jgi:hypothetical protein
MNDVIFTIRFFLRALFIILLFVLIIFGHKEFWIEAVHHLRAGCRWLLRRRRIRPITVGQPKSVSEKPIAIMVPAGDESSKSIRHLSVRLTCTTWL